VRPLLLLGLLLLAGGCGPQDRLVREFTMGEEARECWNAGACRPPRRALCREWASSWWPHTHRVYCEVPW